MGHEARALKAQLGRIGAAKEAARAQDAEYWRSLPLEERVLRAVRHADAMLRAHPPDPEAVDDEHEVWARVNRRLHARP